MLTINKTIASLGAATLLVTGMGVAAHADNKLTGTDKNFMTTVSQGNMAEVMSSQLALKKSKNPNVRKIADMLILQHGQAEMSLKQVAKTKRYGLPPGTDAKHRQMYRMLTRKSGAAFDKAYLTGLVGDHYATIHLFQKEMEKGGDSDVRGFAAKYLPDIQTHTTMITGTASTMGIPTAMGKMTSAAMPMAHH